MRTAAASLVATKVSFHLEDKLLIFKNYTSLNISYFQYLVNGNPRILAILGAGTQARSHFYALSTLYAFSEVCSVIDYDDNNT